MAGFWRNFQGDHWAGVEKQWRKEQEIKSGVANARMFRVL